MINYIIWDKVRLFNLTNIFLVKMLKIKQIPREIFKIHDEEQNEEIDTNMTNP